MLHVIAATLLALPALAVTPQAGDIVLLENDVLNPGLEWRRVLLDPDTGDGTVVSCWGGLRRAGRVASRN